MASKVLLILGYGPNIGKHTASKFASNGYKVAVASRRIETGLAKDTGYYHIQTDFSQADNIASVFTTVEKEVGTPNVILYNAAGNTVGKADDPLAPALADIHKDIHINFISLLAAAKEAVRGFRTLPASAPKVFLYTGNKLNDPSFAMPMLMSLAVGKVASSVVIRDSASAYVKDGFRFYYVDERNPQGAPIFNAIGGEAHADEFWKLVLEKEQLPWWHTFAKGEGYINFDA